MPLIQQVIRQIVKEEVKSELKENNPRIGGVEQRMDKAGSYCDK